MEKIINKTDSVLIGNIITNGESGEFRLDYNDRTRHTYIIGQTGTGKSSLLVSLANEDINNGKGLCFIDPHGDAIDIILKYFPKERIDDLILLNAGDRKNSFGLNILEAKTEQEKNTITNDIIELFINVFGKEVWGPRLEDYIRNGILTLLDQKDVTILHLTKLLFDKEFQAKAILEVKNPIVKAWWNNTFAKIGDREKKEIFPKISAIISRISEDKQLSNIIGQRKTTFDIENAMQSGKVILVNLSKGYIGDMASKIIGSMIITQIKITAFRRGNLTFDERTPFYLYVDEFQQYVDSSIGIFLHESRKYGLGMTFANQYLDQLKYCSVQMNNDSLKDFIFGNVGSIISMKVGMIDAEILEKQFIPKYTKDDLSNLEKYSGIARLFKDGNSTSPEKFIIPNIDIEPIINNEEQINFIKDENSTKYGIPNSQIEKEIINIVAEFNDEIFSSNGQIDLSNQTPEYLLGYLVGHFEAILEKDLSDKEKLTDIGNLIQDLKNIMKI